MYSSVIISLLTKPPCLQCYTKPLLLVLFSSYSIQSDIKSTKSEQLHIRFKKLYTYTTYTHAHTAEYGGAADVFSCLDRWGSWWDSLAGTLLWCHSYDKHWLAECQCLSFTFLFLLSFKKGSDPTTIRVVQLYHKVRCVMIKRQNTSSVDPLYRTLRITQPHRTFY